MNVLTFRMQIKQICGKQIPFTHTARILQTGKNKKRSTALVLLSISNSSLPTI
ncbi:hypothetical protein M104_4778 [Bacteroides fragilis str. 1007-1-F |uniref:Uncharacterized protein n=1 Tax=Bacteroides fragilis str. 1007-1-F \|nr:hypothetical protein M101_4252 [Bacteroides fragilis str. 1007-1-F \